MLRVANSLWPQARYPFRDEFLELVGRCYAAAVKVVEYIEAPEAARLAINTWVEEPTEGKIRDLVPLGGVDALTRLVLVNAISFDGMWVHQFDVASTRTGPFHLLDGRSRGEGDRWRAGRLPYRGRASMLVVVPDEERFADVEAYFGPGLLAEVLEVLELRRLHLVLPRFASPLDNGQLDKHRSRPPAARRPQTAYSQQADHSHCQPSTEPGIGRVAHQPEPDTVTVQL